MLFSIRRKLSARVCTIIGHSWYYKDYTNFIKSNGDEYDFTASRCCSRCNQHSYFSSKWENKEKSKLDFESEFYSTRSLSINEIRYS